MYRTIAPFYDKWKDADALVLGTGPSVDVWLKKGGLKFKSGVVITINRACVMAPNAEFSFFDTPFSLKACSAALGTLQRICLPIFSLGKIILNDTTIKKYLNKIFFYNWDYKGWNKLAPDMYNHSLVTNKKLNLWQLFIENGNAQSVAVFAKMIGCKSIYFVGIDGQGTKNTVFSKTLKNYEQTMSMRKKKKQLHKYKLSKDGLVQVLKKIGMEYEFCPVS